VVFDQQPVTTCVCITFQARHVALVAAHLGQLLQALGQRLAGAGLLVERACLGLALGDEPVKPGLAEQLADRADQLHAELCMRVRKAAVAGRARTGC
jgi:hypothetical protein